MSMQKLLIEIGTEEIPAGYIEPALHGFSERLRRRLDESRITYGEASVFGTPRRLAVSIDQVADRQQPQTIETLGPPERIAFDGGGRLTVAARKFAEKCGVPPRQLTVKDTDKGRYVVARKTDRGTTTRNILKDALPGLILSIPFPKSMRWGELSIHFARPIHSLVALFGRQLISFPLGDVKSGRHTFGHRFLSPRKIKLDSADNYEQAFYTEKAWVIPGIEKRRGLMEEQMEEAVSSVGGFVLSDPELVGTVVNLVEYPTTVLGSFDRRFLELPEEVLITAMREHQRYFAVVDEAGGMMPHFLAVNNTRARDMNLVIRGHERVLKARLEDARFFFQTDRNTALDEMIDRLTAVVFQAELGSVYDKVCRVRALADHLAEKTELEISSRKDLQRAAWLCKADLVSHVVDEFPRLQGVMGRIYAGLSGESAKVCRAIEEHYRPTASGARLPETLVGSILSIADKTDTICGCFLAGLIPTGASDPYALRRQAIGLIQIILSKNLSLSILELVERGVSVFELPSGSSDKKRALEQASAFLSLRLAHILEAEGISKDAVAAVIAATGGEPLPVVAAKARALERLREEPEFDTLAEGFKRVVNIIRKADPADLPEDGGGGVDPTLFAYPAETALLDDFQEISEQVSDRLGQGAIEDAFKAVSGMRKSVDRFFDDVLVMTDEVGRRRNRLALLYRISRLFGSLADFSKIST